MAFSRAVFTVLLLGVVCNASYVPVFMWGDLAAPNLKSNPLAPTTSPAFSDILSEELAKDPFTVVFIDQTLSIEDFSRRNVDGKTSFPYLQENIGKSVYLPSVENAIEALSLLDDPEKAQVELTNGLLPELPGKFVIINLEEAREGESRAELLRRHNDFMKETTLKLQEQFGSVVAIYTARQPSWAISHSRARRQAEGNNANTNASEYELDGLRLYAKIQLMDAGNTVTLNGLTSSSTEVNDTLMTATLNFQNESLLLSFKAVRGYWYFDSVTLDAASAKPEELRPVEELYSLIDFSYRCAQSVIFVHTNSTRSITFEDIKVQPFFTNNTNSTPPFGDPFYCVGFFSAPIWSGLFVVFILLFITFYGIMMMMDIRTMDRFDDPKGKTITINAE